MKICLAGEGAMGVNHMKSLKTVKDVEVVSVAGGIQDDVEKFAKEWNVPHFSLDLEECLDRPEIEAVILATPTNLHTEHACLALSKGKHVLLEIPMGLTLADSERVAEAAKSSGKTCMIAHTRRFSPPHSSLRRRIQEGSFHLHHFVVETYFFRRTNLNMFGKPRTWVDCLLWHHACHSVDLIQWILGDPDMEVWGQKGPDHPELGIPMDMSIGMRSKKGPLVTMALSFNNKGPFGGFYRYIGEEETYKIFRDEMTDSEGKDVSPGGAAFEIQDQEFFNALREGRQPESSVESCLPSMVLLDRIGKSMGMS
ncbi:MAG: Gfo/Idh/MocA family oxidoreductase [Rhodospirillales bacterium]|nr:Gfo/Idh/MocA family oxidoreductase [Rhodospirillales bacterium]